MEAKVYNKDSKQTSTTELPEELFSVQWNPDLVHQVVVAMQANKRPNVAHTKERDEVRGGGKKPWRQKGTGRARHGSIRSPLWVGGGITFGPRSDKDYTKKITKKMKNKALFSVLSKKMEDGEVFFAEKMTLDKPSTKEAVSLVDSIAKASGEDVANKSVCVFVNGGDKNLEKSFNNISNINTEEVRNINPLLLLEHKYVIFLEPETALETLKERYGIVKGEKAFVK